MLIPISYCAAAREIASRTQVEVDQIRGSDKYKRESNWKVFGIGTLTLVLFMVIVAPVFVAMESLGWVSLEPTG